MTPSLSTLRFVFVFVVLALVPGRAFAGTGILLLAHGGSAAWNQQVTTLAAEVNRTTPTEVAFGMATKSTIQGGVDRLVARGVTDIVAVPLFVSSWSSIITSTEYLLGLRAEAPEALAMYASMNHGEPASASAHAGHEGHQMPNDGTTPIKTSVPIRLTPALNDHPIVADILASRAQSISRSSNASVIIVAHGPNEDEDNRRWLPDMGSLAAPPRTTIDVASIDCLTLRDDAPDIVRDAATTELRDLVSRHIAEGRQVLIVPLLVSFGGIDRGLQERLNGLNYSMPSSGIAPDDRLVTWVLTMAGQPDRSGDQAR